MSFHSGRVSFCRFHVTGDAPPAVDETALSILKEHKFQETEIGAPDEVEVGWITGEHLLDTQFTYEKNGYGSPAEPMLLLAMRMDTHKVPADVKQAYRKINEQAAASDNPSGFASKADKRDAKDLSTRQVQEDLAAGKFRRSKQVPVLWDLKRNVVYAGATGNAVVEELASLFRRSFAVELEVMSSGTLAGHVMRSEGRSRDWEDLHPSPFTPPPAEAHADHEDADGVGDVTIPSIPWRAQAIDLKDFLGNEFLLWLWWKCETAEGMVSVTFPGGRTGEVFAAMDKTLDMDCAWDVRGKQSLRGHAPQRLGEANEALATGKWPRKAGLIISDGEHQWELSLQADRWQVSSAALPEIAEAESPREITEARLELVRSLADTLDSLYQAFLLRRVGGGWANDRQAIRDWIKQQRPGRKQPAEPATAGV
ncbi:hypothetical protein ACERK3_03330 [Phycisphaerales bacterium AB-hyl4]|uniref:Recombination-associated protein RdgC n=1 Tax=Natronomicrosphaera hydrolytica TaxID=3242702 RepID=A0ABV4U4U1_9BACT